LNQLLGWPFRAASGTAYADTLACAIDVSHRHCNGQTTALLGTLIFTRVQDTEIAEGQPVSIIAEDGDNAWSDFALVARDLLGERPLAAIPLATRIASATVEAFEQR